jgi:hypothetical protein
MMHRFRIDFEIIAEASLLNHLLNHLPRAQKLITVDAIRLLFAQRK